MVKSTLNKVRSVYWKIHRGMSRVESNTWLILVSLLLIISILINAIQWLNNKSFEVGSLADWFSGFATVIVAIISVVLASRKEKIKLHLDLTEDGDSKFTLYITNIGKIMVNYSVIGVGFIDLNNKNRLYDVDYEISQGTFTKYTGQVSSLINLGETASIVAINTRQFQEYLYNHPEVRGGLEIRIWFSDGKSRTIIVFQAINTWVIHGGDFSNISIPLG